MASRVVAQLVNAVFWSALLIVVTGGVDLRTTVAGQEVHLDATRPDLLVLLFLLLLVAWRGTGRSFEEIHSLRLLREVHDRLVGGGSKLFSGIVALAVVAYLLVPLVRHHSFLTGVDLALFGQAFWNTLQGDFLVSSIRGEIVLWGEHFNPIVLGLLPFYWIWPSPETLLVLQSLALVVGAIPLYALARRELPRPELAIVFALAYLLYLPVRLTNIYDVHPIAFATPLILAAFYCMRKESYGWFLFFCVLVGATKETGPIAVGLLGVSCFFLNRRRWLGASVVAASVGWFLANLYVFMPAFDPAGVSTQLARYGYLGTSLGEILRTLVTQPLFVLSQNASSSELFYPVEILAPLAFLPLITPVGLLTVPYLAINVLEGTGIQLWLIHYQAEVTAFAFIAAVFGARRLLSRRSSRTLAAVIAAGTFLFFGQSGAYRLREAWPSADASRVHAALADVPADARVSAQAATAPHLTQRRFLYVFPEISSADWIVFDRSLDPWPVEPAAVEPTLRAVEGAGFERKLDEAGTLLYWRPDSEAEIETRPTDRRSSSISSSIEPASKSGMQ